MEGVEPISLWRKTLRANALLRVALLLGLVSSTAVQAQDLYTFSLGVMGGVGGSLDADPGDDLGNLGLQLNASFVTAPRTFLGIRVGQLALDESERFGTLADAGLTYATIAGEYRYSYSFYESGLYLGLGGYRLTGDDAFDGSDRTDTSFGLTLGLTGEFEMTRRLGLVAEIAGHWADFDEAQLFVTGHVGVAFHF